VEARCGEFARHGHVVQSLHLGEHWADPMSGIGYQVQVEILSGPAMRFG